MRTLLLCVTGFAIYVAFGMTAGAAACLGAGEPAGLIWFLLIGSWPPALLALVCLVVAGPMDERDEE